MFEPEKFVARLAALVRPPRLPRERRPYPWAELMRRAFVVDVLECPRCQRPMRILAAIHPRDTTGAILECVGPPARSAPWLGLGPGSDPSPPAGATLSPC